jgi:hypothetical protein
VVYQFRSADKGGLKYSNQPDVNHSDQRPIWGKDQLEKIFQKQLRWDTKVSICEAIILDFGSDYIAID